MSILGRLFGGQRPQTTTGKRLGVVIGCGFMPSTDDMNSVAEILVGNEVDVNHIAFRCMEAHGTGGTGYEDVYIGNQRLADIITEKQARFLYWKIGKKQGGLSQDELTCMECTLYGGRQCWVVFPS